LDGVGGLHLPVGAWQGDGDQLRALGGGEEGQGRRLGHDARNLDQTLLIVEPQARLPHWFRLHKLQAKIDIRGMTSGIG
jgi:hypothetical protein